MHQFQIALVDVSEEYVYGFMNYFNTRKDGACFVTGFTRWEAFETYMQSHHPTCIFLSIYYSMLAKTMSWYEEMKDRIFWLHEEQTTKAEHHFFKYQSLECLMSAAIDMSKVSLPTSGWEISNCIAVYSPMSACGKTTLAYDLTREKQQKGKTLLIPMEEYADTPVTDSGLESVLYGIKSRSVHFRDEFMEQVKETEGVFILPPVMSYMDLRQLSVEDMEWFIGQLHQIERYEYIIFDVGVGCFSDLATLAVFDELHVIRDEKNGKYLSFVRMLRNLHLDYLLEQIQYHDLAEEKGRIDGKRIVVPLEEHSVTGSAGRNRYDAGDERSTDLDDYRQSYSESRAERVSFSAG
ncbi:MAG: hypothetical protein ACI4CT_07245 [Lachnospiraceae bacterium]